MTNYGYDSEGNLTSLTPPAPEHAESFGYDALSRQTCAIDGDGNMTTYIYNALDEVVSKGYGTDVGGTCPHPNSPTSQTSTVVDADTYDADGNLTQEVAGGEISSDAYNNLDELTQQVLPTGQSVSYGYDAAGNMTSFTDGAGTYVYQYNDLNQLKQLTEPNGKITTFAYNPEGERTAINYPNAVTVSYSWNPAGQLTDIEEGPLNAIDTAYTYETGPSGTTSSNLISQVTTGPVGGSNPATTNYTYDALNRLLSATTTGASTSTYQYQYDGDGNMTYENLNGTTFSPTYVTGSDEQSNFDGQAQGYDADGNLTSESTTTATYNTLDQPTSVAGVSLGFFGSGQSNETALGSYTFQNTQLGLTAASLTTQPTLLQKLLGQGPTVTTNYITAAPDGEPLGELASGTGAGDYYYVTNPVTNTVLYVTNASGTLVRTNKYDPYGTQSTSGTGPNDIGWDGAFANSGLSLLHFGARQYATTDDRWIQPDPDATSLVADPTQDDPFAIDGDDPINNTDPAGTGVGGNCLEYHTKKYCENVERKVSGGDGVCQAVGAILGIFGIASGEDEAIAGLVELVGKKEAKRILRGIAGGGAASAIGCS